jgi:hypothetical protein
MVQGMEEQYGSQIIRADVPLAEMFGYATTLRSMSQGRATYTMEFHHFAEAPRNVADEIISACEVVRSPSPIDVFQSSAFTIFPLATNVPAPR